MNGLDFLVLAKIMFWPTGRWTAVAVAKSIGVHRSQVMTSLARLKDFNFISSLSHEPVKHNIENLIKHSIRLLYPPKWVYDDKAGMPTAWSARPLAGIIASKEYVIWPDPKLLLPPQSKILGQGLEPIHAKLPKACSEDNLLYQFCSLVDAIRAGKVREQSEAHKLIKWMLDQEFCNAR